MQLLLQGMSLCLCWERRQSCDTGSKLRKPARKPRAGAWKSLNKGQGLGKMPSESSKPGSPTGLLTGSDPSWESIISMHFSFVVLPLCHFQMGSSYQTGCRFLFVIVIKSSTQLFSINTLELSSCSNSVSVGWTATHLFFSLPFISLTKSTDFLFETSWR